MGYLSEKVFNQVDRLSRERGRSYFIGGAVKRIEGDAWRVDARVKGSHLYGVRIAFADDFLEVNCSCPFFDRDLVTCKHIWAAVLAAEREGFLKGPASRPSLELIETYDGDEEFADEIGQDPRPPKEPPLPSWKQQLQTLRGAMESAEARLAGMALPEREMLYLIDAREMLEKGRLIVEIAQRERKLNGSWSKPKSRKIRAEEIARLPDPADRQIAAILLGAWQELGYSYPSYYYNSAPAQFTLPITLWDLLLPLMCGTGRCLLRASRAEDEDTPLEWDDGPPWELCLNVTRRSDGAHYKLTGALRREERELDLTQPVLLLAGGLVFYNGQIARLQDHGAFGWISLLRAHGSLSIPEKDADPFLGELLCLPRQPRLELPAELELEAVTLCPKAGLVIKPSEQDNWFRPRLVGKLSFEYEGETIAADHSAKGIYQKERRRLIRRDLEAESAARSRLKQLGFRSTRWTGDSELELSSAQLPKAVRALTNEGWHVEAEGKLFRTAGALNMEINSGVDWFELEGRAQFGDTEVALPQLLRAIKQGEQTVRLDDGTLGIIPEQWLKKYGLLAGLGDVEGHRLRFTRSQAGLLDALLASEPEVTVDAVFAHARQELQSFAGVTPAAAPAEFCGELRGYQREGLGWLFFLRRFGFGGCLADDMGLGKTIQVLALLDSRRASRAEGAAESLRPSLVVVPRSLVFHWQQEAARFAPKLRVLDHTGGGRLKPGDHFDGYHLVITTYGTLRRDALSFKDVRFDYCILDEAQAIKNAGTLSAKAARLLGADHRLALSGTPVENHLGELWSLFEFLNPGMLGSATVFGRAGRNPDEQTRSVLARALRPFILRRTKGEVARELPPKTEQTIYCELEPKERKLYDELRAYYRSRLMKNLDHDGMGRVKIQVLEALLRLRQAACHPGLIDKSKTGEPSKKIDTLLAQLDQVQDEGHKALVFSQFTSLLAIVRSRLDAAKISYAYLDGRTRDREARVREFQNDPNLKLFLISLKAGGLGLNLHAAEYVYLLDPWWNPAVETQAIDRAHRIGQTRQVFAYRLIARDTVEEKVLELQKTKRDLAEAIITADNSVMRNLTREDLELLLS
ncbi:MAG: DEAD/DEAH box helicase [Deltaproteobacteria bacterium]|nr:DEAD/DEAH box helicase [Deltaproteobacteria bacterium]